MRRSGCGGAVVTLVVAGALLSLLLPVAAGGIVTFGLEAAGLRAERLEVRVEASPSLRLLTGRADRVLVTGTGVQWGGTTAASLSLTLGGVDLLGRRAETVYGGLNDLLVDGPGGVLVVAWVTLSGVGSAPWLSLDLSPEEAARVVGALAGRLGLGLAQVELAAPDRVVVEVAGRRLVARIAVVDGAVVVEGAGVPQLVVLAAGSVRGFEPRSVAVGPDGGVLVEGYLDPRTLGLAG